MQRLNELHRKLMKPKGEDCTRGSSRSASKGRITGGCSVCGGKMIIKYTEHYNCAAECNRCGLTENLGWTTLSQRGI